jgi:hypothetical protein
MKKPKCNCGAMAANSHVHAELCDVTQFERQERLMGNLYMDDLVKLRPITIAEPALDELVEQEKAKYYQTYRWRGNA